MPLLTCSDEPLLRHRRGSEIKYLGCIWRKSVIFKGGTISIRRNHVLSEFLPCTVNINAPINVKPLGGRPGKGGGFDCNHRPVVGFFDRFNDISSNILLTFGCYFDNPQCPGVGHLNGNSQLSSNAPPMSRSNSNDFCFTAGGFNFVARLVIVQQPTAEFEMNISDRSFVTNATYQTDAQSKFSP